MVVLDFTKLRGRIREVLGTEKLFSEAMGWSGRTTSLKLNGKVQWKQEEIMKAIKVLHLSERDIPIYFFATKAQSC